MHMAVGRVAVDAYMDMGCPDGIIDQLYHWCKWRTCVQLPRAAALHVDVGVGCTIPVQSCVRRPAAEAWRELTVRT